MASRGANNKTERYQQMSKQEQLIEEKKRQILNRLHDKRRAAAQSQHDDSSKTESKSKDLLPPPELQDTKPSTTNAFTNDGSFLDQFQKFADQNKHEFEALQRIRERSRSPQRQPQTHQLPGFGWGECPQIPPPPIPPHCIPAPSPLIPQTIPPPRPMDITSIPPPDPLAVHRIPPPPLPPGPFPPPNFFNMGIPPPPPPSLPMPVPPPALQVPADSGRSLAANTITCPVKEEPDEPSYTKTCSFFKVKEEEPDESTLDCGLSPADNQVTYPVKEEPVETSYSKTWVKEEKLDEPSSSTVTLSQSEMKHDIKKKEQKDHIKEEIKLHSSDDDFNNADFKTEDAKPSQAERERKRRSRWGEKVDDVPPPVVATTVPKIKVTGMSGHLLTKVTRTEPGLLQYAMQAYGSTNLSEEDWKKAEDNYKVHLLYQDMLSKRAEVQKLHAKGKHKYEYDSDEETEGGTWEHRLREKEMVATKNWAESLTEMAKGKHHIGDFLPPDELKRFMDKYSALKGGSKEPDLSDYKEYKLTEENKGFQMLQKLGWTEGQGLGSDGGGIVEPINKAKTRDTNQGLGVANPGDVDGDDDEYAAYRKRMMLAYRFRPNPLNNPRRPYY